ncbi:Hypothetical protein, conserved [Brucella abortus str. 2308 A]|uniref:Uncharacterized protein n=2 Tax=Brucella TaxID=234 RepID=A0A0H3APL6_BRUO2|nr:hypothetical protein BOV_0161 [Brucella ovis ATCC 25840]ADZ65254.1 conserved hypothetical protein [Brucella melitensis M28]ADZ86119.1 conserved hypothetical protein [Brucella melitensis M5-90]AEW13921.1 hypothetical protein BCA52141_I1422 [Brucella canis HSK A52141]AEW16498.1 hypothetical protein BAA13334_I00201 [Brucella abortus A13334]AIB16901.1 Hypothetical protein BSSP3_I0165 [Brucella suis bv. 2]EEH15405.1 Hypothetical protein, conserved [Brucella ceti str. Cudo]EEP63684.1 Hypothetic
MWVAPLARACGHTYFPCKYRSSGICAAMRDDPSRTQSRKRVENDY